MEMKRRKNALRLLALLLVLVMALSACGGGGNSQTNDGGQTNSGGQTDNGGGQTDDAQTNGGGQTDDAQTGDTGTKGEPIKDLVVWKVVTAEIDTLVMQHSESSEVSAIGGNCISPLIEFDNYGALVPAVATEWGTEDEGLTWTFHLRDDVTWVDIDGNKLGDVTSADWVTGLEFVLNYYKNGSFNTSMPFSTIAGAEDYYNYTKNDISEADALALAPDNETFLSMVGIEAPDPYTLVYHCKDKIAYFDTLATGSCLYPIPQGMIDAVGIKNFVGISNDDFWYSGPYRLTTYTQNNVKVLTRNESYWDKDCTLFDTVTIRMVEDGLTDDMLWTTGEVDYTTLNQATLAEIMANPSDERYDNLVETRITKFVNSYLPCYWVLNKDGTPDTNWNTAIANENFRKSLYWGLNLVNYWYLSNPINPMSRENLAYTSRNLSVFSDGKDYVDRVIELLDDMPEGDGQTPRRYQPELAQEYKAKAMEELSAKGVTFPVEYKYFIKSGDQNALDSANILKEIFEDLGTDYINFTIDTYISSSAQEVMFPQLQSMYEVGWGADFGDVSNFLDQVLYDDPSAIYSTERLALDEVQDPEVIALFKEYTEMVRKAEAITGDPDARYEAFAQAEAFLINHALVMPTSYSNNWQLTKINDYSKMYAAYGISDAIYKNWETSTVPYTTEDYARFAEEYANHTMG